MSTPMPGPSPAPKKLNPIIIILLVLVGLFVLGGIAIVGGGLYIAHRVVNHPGSTVAKLLTAANPDVEVISTDDDRGTITFRDKHDGKTVTMSFDDIKNGKLKLNADGKEVSIETKTNGTTGGIELKTSDGDVVKLGAVGEKLPAWIPTFPGTPAVQAVALSHTNKEDAGGTSFELKEPVSAVADYYYDALNKSGFKATKTLASADTAIVQGIDETTHRSVNYTINRSGSTTSVNVSFSQKKD